MLTKVEENIFRNYDKNFNMILLVTFQSLVYISSSGTKSYG